MSIVQNFLPSAAIESETRSYIHNADSLDVTETRLHDYMTGFQSMLAQQGFHLSPEEIHSLQTASALLDALAKTRLDESDPNFPVLAPHHHAFNVFYQAPGSLEWKLQFANSAYSAMLEGNLSDIVQKTETVLMEKLYTSATIEKFNAAAQDSQNAYRAQFIEMDNVELDVGEDMPAFFWYRKEFDHPDGGKIQVRIGMNGTGLSAKQQTELVDAYKLTDILRTRDISSVHYSKYPCDTLMSRTQEKIDSLLSNGTGEGKKLIRSLEWMNMILTIADDIVKNSPFPLTVVDTDGAIEQISPAYAAIVWHTVEEILKPDFLTEIYRGTEGELVDQSIAYYEEHGHYPEGISFGLKRGDSFHLLENEENLIIPKSIEIIPFPYSFEGGTIRVNSTLPYLDMNNAFLHVDMDEI